MVEQYEYIKKQLTWFQALIAHKSEEFFSDEYNNIVAARKLKESTRE